MDIETIRDYCLAKKGTTEGFPFGEDFLVFKVMGKMTACIKLECPDLITLKCDPDYALELRDHYPGGRRCLSLQQKNIGIKYH